MTKSHAAKFAVVAPARGSEGSGAWRTALAV
jgi:hypothetical protein